MSRQKNFDDYIYSNKFGMEGPHLVAASAGTGKTYNIQNIYVRLVAEQGLRVAQIQVMTYTEAATKELRDRIRRILFNFSRFLAVGVDGLRQDDVDVDQLQKLRDCIAPNANEDELKLVRARVELALMEFDQAAISTIHGFCRRALARFAFETGNPFRSEFEDNKKQDLTQRAKDWWRTERKRTPEGVAVPFSLDDLTGYTDALSGKADWKVKGADGDNSSTKALERAAEINAEYERDRAMREKQTFDDLLRGLREALLDTEKGPVLAEHLREEFKAVLIDEFQDTDPVQYDIFRIVFLDTPANPRPTLFFVGDPKQAIYSFRGGDIYTYKRAVESDDVKANSYRLDMNYRSTPRLVEAVNMIFKDAVVDGTPLRTFGDDAIDYSDDLKSSGKISALKIDGKDDPKPFRFIWVENATIDRNLAVVDAVLSVLEEQGPNRLTPKDIAVLVPSHSNARELWVALRERGVPAVLQRSGNVFSDTVAEEFRIVLQAMARMGGAGQVRAALATSFFNISPLDLQGENGDAVLADMVGKFCEWNRIWKSKGFNAAFATLESDSTCDLRRRFAKEAGGERKIADLLQITELAAAAVRDLGPAPELLVDWITDRINNSSKKDGSESDSEEYARQLESEEDAVKLLTKHYSKGLGFPVVIVPLSNERGVSAPYFFHEGSKLIVSVDDADAEKAKAEIDAETTRLLYVAFTRAFQRTVVVAPSKLLEDVGTPLARLKANAEKNGACREDSPISMSEFVVTEQVKARMYAAVAHPGRELREAETPAEFSESAVGGSYSALAPSGHVDSGDGHDRDKQDDDAAEKCLDAEHPIFAIRGGTKTGDCWHDILEKIPFDADDGAVRSAVERAMRTWGVAKPDSEEWGGIVDVTSEMIRKTLDFGLVSPVGEAFSLRDVVMADRFSEWEFDFSSSAAVDTTADIVAILKDEWKDDPSRNAFLSVVEGWSKSIPKGFFKGFLDLLFRHGDYYYIVDWKSNVLNRRSAGFDEKGVADEIASTGYFFQYLLYSVVLHRYLRETLGDGYSWERNFGGVRYYFLRGIAADGPAPVFADRPGERLLDRLADAFGLGGK